MKMVLRLAALTAAFAVTSVANAATVYCPNGPGGALSAPLSGRYVVVTNAANPGACSYTDGNWDESSGGQPLYEERGFTLVDKNGSPGTYLLNSGGLGKDITSGTWELAANIWDSFDKLYLGFHFGNGGGSPDSFIVELKDGQQSGRWDFLAIDPEKVNGLSNIYLFSTGDSTSVVPLPAAAWLLLSGLAGLGVLGRRRKTA